MQEPEPAQGGRLEDLALISEAAAEAGRIAMRYFRDSPQVWMKGTSPVSEADYAVDEYLTKTLRAARPGYGWLSEETVDTAERLSLRRAFVVDPIDGTRAYIEGKDTWCISIAVIEDGRPVAGVLDVPAFRDVYTAAAGSGARLNGKLLSPKRDGAAVPSIAGPKPMVTRARSILGRVDDAGYFPSLAYRIALVAAGRIDATFVRPNSNHWDLAAADLILTETGGALLNRSGKALDYSAADPKHGSLVASAGHLLDRLSGVLAGFDE